MALRFVLGSAPSKLFLHFNRSVQQTHRWVSLAVSHQDVLNVYESKTSELKNQLRVATEAGIGGTATVGVWIEAGSRHETTTNNGVAHLLERLAFKGTAKKSAADIEQLAQAHAIQLSAYTGRELISVEAKCLANEVPKAVEILADVVQGNALNEKEIEKQKTILLKELEDAENDTTLVTQDYMYSAAFQGTPLAKSILGTSESLRGLLRPDVSNYVSTYFKAPRMILAAAGAVDHTELVQLAEKHFTSTSLNEDGLAPPKTPCRFTGSEVRARYDDLPHAHLAIAVQGPTCYDEESITLSVAQKIIGSWDRTYGAGKNLAGKLAAACSEFGAAHSFHSFYHKYSDNSLWGLHFVATGIEDVDDVLHYVQSEWMRLCTSVTDFEVERAKNQLKTAILSDITDTSYACRHVARRVFLKTNWTSLAELEARIDSVNANMVREMCMKYIYDKCPVVSGYGPLECMPDYNRVRGGMYWLRL